MPTNVEIRPQEVFKSLESWRRWFLTILLLVFLGAIATDVDASDAESIYRENQTISLTVENVAVLYDTIAHSGNDVEGAPANPEVEPEAQAPEVFVGRRVNVRSLDSNASTLRDFPRGNADVIGWFGATSADNFGSTAEGLWFVIDNGGQLGAVFSGVINEVDGTALTVDELNEAGIPQFTFEMGVPTPPAPEEVDAAPTDAASENGEEGEEGVEVAMAPELNVPNSVETQIAVFNATTNTFEFRDVTIEINHDDSLEGLPFGIIDPDSNPAIRAMVDRLAEAQDRDQGASTGPQWETIPVKAVLVQTTPRENGWPAATFAIPDENGNWTTFDGGFFGAYYYSPLNDDLESVFPAGEWHSMDSNNFESGNIPAGSNPVEIGDEVVIFLYNPPEGQNTSISRLQFGSCNGRTTEDAINFISEGGTCSLTNNPSIDYVPYAYVRGIASND
jgi:hypothetical protein